jgi:hypothetical protein
MKPDTKVTTKVAVEQKPYTHTKDGIDTQVLGVHIPVGGEGHVIASDPESATSLVNFGRQGWHRLPDSDLDPK